MRTKDFILLGAGYAAGRLMNKTNSGFIGATKKNKCLILYHSTSSPILGKFRIKGNSGFGIYLAKKISYSKTFGDITYKVKVCPKNTLIFNDNEVKGKGFFNMSKSVYDDYISKGFDSLAWYRRGNLTEFVVLNPNIIQDFNLYRK